MAVTKQYIEILAHQTSKLEFVTLSIGSGNYFIFYQKKFNPIVLAIAADMGFKRPRLFSFPSVPSLELVMSSIFSIYDDRAPLLQNS